MAKAAAKKKVSYGPPAKIVNRRRGPNKPTLADAVAAEHLRPAAKAPKKDGRTTKLLDRYQQLMAQVKNFEGESERSLARELGVSQTPLRSLNIRTNSEKTRTVAKDLAKAELAQAALPLVLQVCARQLADELKLVAMNMAATARNGSETARHLSLVAKTQASKINEENAGGPEGLQHLQAAAAYTEVANRAAHVGLNLLNANKEFARDAINTIDVEPEGVPDDPVRAAQTYQRMIRG